MLMGVRVDLNFSLDGNDVRVGGGVSTVREFLKAGLVDQLHVAVAPILLGRGISLWSDLRGFEDG
jgi:dihydrofolate reductase